MDDRALWDANAFFNHPGTPTEKKSDKRSSYPINTKPNTTNFVIRYTDNENVEHNIAEFHINFPIQNMYGEIEESFTAAMELISLMISMMYIVGR